MSFRSLIRAALPVWETYDPSWLVALAREQHPDDVQLAKALSNCTRAICAESYVAFVSNSRQNLPGSEWQFGRNVILEGPDEEEIVIDVLKDGRIGGLEFWQRRL